jgi:cyclophilin family peptidyl-prolyl cis-trans isomerase
MVALCLLLPGACCLEAGTLAQFRTPFGDIEVELYDQQKPVTVRNFERLVHSGAYQNTFFSRLIPGFVAQGGGYFNFNPASTNLFGPPWSNVGSVPNFGAITNEFYVGPRLSNTNGTIAMAKVGNDPNSATCEWFFNLADNSANLDNQNGGFTVFGHVVRDSSGVLGLFNSLHYGYGMQNLQSWYTNDAIATNLFQNLPVIYQGNVPPHYPDLVYVDISLLSVQISTTNQQRQISWNSINGATNVVEYTTVLPPVWKTLTATNGNGSRLTVPDPTSANSFRFYRVRVGF